MKTLHRRLDAIKPPKAEPTRVIVMRDRREREDDYRIENEAISEEEYQRLQDDPDVEITMIEIISRPDQVRPTSTGGGGIDA